MVRLSEVHWYREVGQCRIIFGDVSLGFVWKGDVDEIQRVFASLDDAG